LSENIYDADLRDAKPRSKAGRFDQISIVLHWLTAVLVTTQFTTAWLLNQGDRGHSAPLFAHRSIGILIWLVVATRVIWRHNFAQLPPFPLSMPKLQQQVAKINEYGLYVLVLLQPLTRTVCLAGADLVHAGQGAVRNIRMAA
jgi:cytochrome b561